MLFHNHGEELLFIGSADWMVRNIDHRVEVACPIYDQTLKTRIIDIIHLQLSDNTKARILLGEALKKQGNPEAALKEFYKAHELDGSFDEYGVSLLELLAIKEIERNPRIPEETKKKIIRIRRQKINELQQRGLILMRSVGFKKAG